MYVDEWLNGPPTDEHRGEICNLQTNMNESHRQQELMVAKKTLHIRTQIGL